MDKQREKAFDFAADLTKLLITLSTGVLALTITFREKVAAETAHDWAVVTAWVLFLASALAGVWTLMALTGELERLNGNQPPSIRGRNVTIPSLIQIIFFVSGFGLVVWFGAQA